MNLRRSNAWLTALAMAGVAWTTLAITTPAARAAPQTFSTAAGAKESGGLPVSATATFTESANTLTITLTNLLANPTSVAQAISDLFFTVANGTLSGATLKSSTANFINIAANKTFSSAGSGSTGFVFTTQTSTTGLLDVLAGPGHAGPAHLIIGPPGGGGTYSNANGSIAGNRPHNPFINQTATFTISGSGITANTTVTAATFSFGTTPGNNVPGNPNVVPEPSTMAIAGLGALGFMGYGLRRRLKK
jgi:hypothetical protein